MRALVCSVAVCVALAAACRLPDGRVGSVGVRPELPTGAVATPPGGAPVAPEKIRLLETVLNQTYRVEGTTPAELRSFMNLYGPLTAGEGKRYAAATNWSLSWSFRYDRSSGLPAGQAGCALAGATVEITVVQVLPELARPDLIGPDTLARWQRFLTALAQHEDGHVERQLAGARALQAAYEAAPPAADCAELGRALNARGEEERAAIHAADAGWDAETGHGRAQGAVFP